MNCFTGDIVGYYQADGSYIYINSFYQPIMGVAINSYSNSNNF